MIEIELTKRYPNSRADDITDAFMRGFMEGRKIASDEIKKCNSAIESLKAEVKGSERSVKGSDPLHDDCFDCDKFFTCDDKGEDYKTDCPWK